MGLKWWSCLGVTVRMVGAAKIASSQWNENATTKLTTTEVSIKDANFALNLSHFNITLIFKVFYFVPLTFFFFSKSCLVVKFFFFPWIENEEGFFSLPSWSMPFLKPTQEKYWRKIEFNFSPLRFSLSIFIAHCFSVCISFQLLVLYLSHISVWSFWSWQQDVGSLHHHANVCVWCVYFLIFPASSFLLSLTSARPPAASLTCRHQLPSSQPRAIFPPNKNFFPLRIFDEIMLFEGRSVLRLNGTKLHDNFFEKENKLILSFFFLLSRRKTSSSCSSKCHRERRIFALLKSHFP